MANESDGVKPKKRSYDEAIFFGVIAALVLGVAIYLKVSGGGDDNKPATPVTALAAPVVTPIAIAPDAHVRARDERIADLHLRMTGIEGARILEHARRDVDALLGKGETRPDRKVSYAWPDGGAGAIVIAYQDGRAVGIEPHTFAPGQVHFDDLTLDDKLLVREWFGLGTTAAIGGREIVIGDDFMHVDFAAYDKRYIDGLNARVEQEAKRAALARDKDEANAREQAKRDEESRLMSLGPQELRGEYLAKLNSTSNGTYTLSVGGDGTAVIVTPRRDGFCSDSILDIYNTDMGAKFRAFGFTWLVCSDQDSRQRL